MYAISQNMPLQQIQQEQQKQKQNSPPSPQQQELQLKQGELQLKKEKQQAETTKNLGDYQLSTEKLDQDRVEGQEKMRASQAKTQAEIEKAYLELIQKNPFAGKFMG